MNPVPTGANLPSLDYSRFTLTSLLFATAPLPACSDRPLGDDGDGDGGGSATSGPDSASASDSGAPEPTSGPGPYPDPSTGPGPYPDPTTTGPGDDCNFEDYFVDVDVLPVDTIAGTQSVLLEVEALPVGVVFAAGYFGLARSFDEGETWEIVPAPDVLSSSFLHLHAESNELWALAHGEAVYTADLGETWQVADLGGASQVFFTWDDRLLVGGEARIGLADAPLGPTDWILVEALDGDVGNYQQNNVVLALTIAFDPDTPDGYLIAAERFGRVARSPVPEGPWHPSLDFVGGSPELLALPGQGIVAIGSDGDVFRSDDHAETWTLVGHADPFPEVAEYSTQLVLTDDDLLVAAASLGFQFSCDFGEHWNVVIPKDGAITYDLTVGPSGTIWAAGYDSVYRIRRN